MSERMARLDKSVIDMVYPVGAIYMSVNSTNPGNLFGGKWEQIKDRFMLACGDTHAAGSTGGEATHKLTVDEMPKHSHQLLYKGSGAQSDYNNTVSFSWTNQWTRGYGTVDNGGGAAHNNMPPYLAVYIWKRTA